MIALAAVLAALTLVAGEEAVPVAVDGRASRPSRIERIDGTTISVADAGKAITRLMNAAHVTGLSVAILNDNRVVYEESFGFSNVDAKKLLRPDTVVYAASLTKALFAYFVMQLVEEKIIDLDTPIQRYLDKPLPEYEKYKDLAGDERYKQITTRMLLSHTAGFPNYRFLKDDGKLDIEFTPGTRYAYSGEGMNLLQFAIEAKTGKSIADMMDTRIFKPFGMTRTAMTWQPRFEDDYALGYDESGKALGHNKRTGVRAAGSLDTTLADYARFVEAVMQGKGLGPRARAEMLRPQIAILSQTQFPTLRQNLTDENHPIHLSYGLGWGLFTTPGGKAFFKEGHDDGWENHVVCFPEKKIAILLLSNSSNADSIFKELFETLAGDRWTPWRWEGYTPYDANVH